MFKPLLRTYPDKKREEREVSYVFFKSVFQVTNVFTEKGFEFNLYRRFENEKEKSKVWHDTVYRRHDQQFADSICGVLSTLDHHDTGVGWSRDASLANLYTYKNGDTNAYAYQYSHHHGDTHYYEHAHNNEYTNNHQHAYDHQYSNDHFHTNFNEHTDPPDNLLCQ
jgi:hypothetical protein